MGFRVIEQYRILKIIKTSRAPRGLCPSSCWHLLDTAGQGATVTTARTPTGPQHRASLVTLTAMPHRASSPYKSAGLGFRHECPTA